MKWEERRRDKMKCEEGRRRNEVGGRNEKDKEGRERELRWDKKGEDLKELTSTMSLAAVYGLSDVL